MNIWGCFSSQGFARIVCFKQNLNVEFICAIYKHGLLPTTQKQFGLESTIWELQEDNDAKHTWKVALNWNASHRIEKIDCLSMLSDLASIENA